MPSWLVIASASLLLYVFLWYRKRLRYFSDRGAPFVPPDNLLGSNVNSLTKRNIYLGEVYRKMYHDYKGHEYVGFFSLLSPTVLVISPRLAEEVLIRDFGSFDDHGLPLDEEANPLEANLFFLSGPRWRALRRKLTPTFTSGKLKGMFPLVEECTDHLLRIVSARVRGGGGEQEVRDLLARFTTDVIGSCAFGVDAGSLADPDSEFRRMGKRFFEPSGRDKLLTALRFTVPSLVKKLRLKRGYRRDETFFIDLVRRGLAQRAAAAERGEGEGEGRQDFLHLLLQLKTLGSVSRDPADLEELGEDKREAAPTPTPTIEFTDNLLAAQAFVFFLAGFETTASAISFTLYLLSKEPAAQRRLREQLRTAKADRGGIIDYETLSAAPFLELCLKESMRLYPPIELLPRICTREHRTKDGFIVEKGTRVVVPVVALHRDPELWSEPDSFRPERFRSPPPPGTYLPFGAGPRTCIAQRFALLEAKLCVAKLVEAFEISLSPETEEPLRLSTHTFVVVPEGGMWLRFKPAP